MNTNILIVCLNAVLPTFLLMAAGFASRSLKLLGDRDVLMMNNLAFKVFMPAMLFYNIYSSDISSAVRPRLLAYAAGGVLAAFALSVVYTLLTVRDKSKQSVYIQGIYRSNFVVIGLPLASALMEGQDMAPVAVLMVVVVPMFNALAVICLETFSEAQALDAVRRRHEKPAHHRLSPRHSLCRAAYNAAEARRKNGLRPWQDCQPAHALPPRRIFPL